MADLQATIVNDTIRFEQIPAGARIVIVIDPVTTPEGNVLYDKTIPVGKTFNGFATINGPMTDVPAE